MASYSSCINRLLFYRLSLTLGLMASLGNTFILPPPAAPAIPVVSHEQENQVAPKDLLLGTQKSTGQKQIHSGWVLLAKPSLPLKQGLTTLKSLNKAGYPGYLIKRKDHAVTLFVGPEITKTTLVAMQKKIAVMKFARAELKQAKIIRFNPFSMKNEVILND